MTASACRLLFARMQQRLPLRRTQSRVRNRSGVSSRARIAAQQQLRRASMATCADDEFHVDGSLSSGHDPARIHHFQRCGPERRRAVDAVAVIPGLGTSSGRWCGQPMNNLSISQHSGGRQLLTDVHFSVIILAGLPVHSKASG